ncbi:MAG TPA: MFS transporter [Jiangellales bacterium]|nr:MFS transporter [Jiangellales bacterium]
MDATAQRTAAGGVLLTLASAQFLMTLDSSVMNVSMATVANDVGTTITGIQTAITLYTLVMATLMITGGKIGTIIGRRRAFSIGCVIYGVGSLTTGLAPNLPVLILGWSFLEGVGAALIMPAIVALVASNFAQPDRPRAYGLVAAAGAIAVAVGPLLGGAATTYGSWRWVFFGEVGVVLVILALSRRVADAPPEGPAKLDLVGTLLSVVGLGTAVYGVLRSSEWGWLLPKEGGPSLFGLSPTFWCVLTGLFVVWLLVRWEYRVAQRGGEPLVQPGMLRNPQLAAGLTMFGFQFLLQAGIFFVVPLFLSVVLELSAIETGLRILPLSVSLLVAATGIPRFRPDASPRRVVRAGMLLILAGILALLGGITLDANAAVVAVPMLLVGLGIGALASQLGSVTVSSVPTEQSGEVGGLQNTATNLGASLGTALAGSVLITVLTTTLVAGIQENPDVPDDVKQQASVELASGVPFLSDTALEEALVDAGESDEVTQAVLEDNREARIRGLDAALAVLALLAILSLFFTGRIPSRQPGSAEAEDAARQEEPAG